MREGQAAVFVHEGQLADVFAPGLYMLETNNMPILTTLQHWDHGFRSPFKSEIYFVNTTRLHRPEVGHARTRSCCRDPEFGPVRLRAFGTYAMRVADPGKLFMQRDRRDRRRVHDRRDRRSRSATSSCRSSASVIAAVGIPVLDMAANTDDLGKLVREPHRAR